MKRVAVYGIGNNCKDFMDCANIQNIEIVALVDTYKAGEKAYGMRIVTSNDLMYTDFDEILVLPADYYDIAKLLTDKYGIKRSSILTSNDVNRKYIFNYSNSVRYIMLTTDIDYLNFPYFALDVRQDYRQSRALFSREKLEFKKGIEQISDEEKYFIVRDHCFPWLKKSGVIDYLKQRYLNSRWSVILSDMCGGEFGRLNKRGEKYINELKDCFELVITYHKVDADKYGLTYYEQAYSVLENIRSIKEYEYDVFFVGNAKNRLDKIYEVFSYLRNNKLRCRFIVNNVDANLQIRDEGITYNTKLMYADYLDEMAKSRCILEICQEGDESTYRYAEAVVYNRKLLTSDISCTRRKYYETGNIKYYENINQIDVNWIKNRDTVDYSYRGEFEPKNLLTFIEERLAH